jgi:flavin-dependent dehydrogenase
MHERFDVVIVGARCAGASLATWLARAGRRVLLLDAARLPSDMVMSTHFVQSVGMQVLDELGVGNSVRALAPGSSRLRIELNDVGMTVPTSQPGHCIRRLHLDTLLQQAALAAGAELRDRSKVTALVREGERVCGVMVQGETGSYRVDADLVVGADGHNSTLAKLTEVEQYLDFDMTRGGYWFYWPKPAVWGSDAYPYDALIRHEGDDMLYVFQCDADQLLIAVAPPNGQVRAWGSGYRERYLAWLRSHALSRGLVEGHEPIGQGMGLLKARFYYRRPVGPGFALVGDAGCFKDFVTGQGITDALLSSRDLAAAVVDGRPAAMQWYWRHRDATSLPLYQDAKNQGALGYNHALNRLVIDRIGKSDALLQRAAAMTQRELLPGEVVPMRKLLGWVAGSALRGRFDVLRCFREVGERVRADQAELAHRRALLSQVEAQLGGSPRPISLHVTQPSAAA